ncbi:MAG: glycosyl hydrolase family 28 protein [Candidatus Pedobacter colombiensis]|uniref:Glycosyl hydrolase family 28 protein n=1 Tax=Candidatus Pedobacter colombiensis TaxID=3121371 RepID=A0AAJ5W988_9SPHI|nr:glycosyl hydrolase family 28 protein [Pedobacter sp.]WEK19970.1 MAG: glycosyl hydrolase family 28 protein [Pedobacter sp.]
MKNFKACFTICLLLFCSILKVNAQEYNIISFGAKPDGVTKCTAAIQKAIDECSKNGGGIVIVPSGKYLSGTVYLKSNVELHLNRNAMISGSLLKADYTARSLVMCDAVENVSITGEGMINGNGENEVFQESNKDRVRPHVLWLRNSKNVTVKDVTLKNAAFWAFRILGSEEVIVNGVRIYNHGATNNDGLDIDGKNIVVSNCIIDSEDDALCFKSDRELPCENVVVSNCVIASDCNPIKMGTAATGGFKNIAISNCIIRKASESSPSQKWKTKVNASSDSLGISGIALEVVDGGTMDQVTITNISMKDIQTPIFIRLGNRKGIKSTVKNIIISNIVATTESYLPSSITGIAGNYVENVILRDILIHARGLGTIEHANAPVPEKDNGYPENRMFGITLPAYGLYVRHVKNLTMNNIQVKLLNPDARPAMIFEDVDNLTLNQFQLDIPEKNQSMLWLKQVTNATFSGYNSAKPLQLFAKIEGDRTDAIRFINNNFSNVKSVFNAEKEVNQKNILKLSNY